MIYFSFSRFFLYLVPFTTVIVTRSTLFPFIVGKYAWFRAAVGFALIFFLLGCMSKNGADEYKRRIVKTLKSPLTIPIALFTFFFFLSGVFGFNPAYSFWSNFERGEGTFQILNLFVFFILTSTLFEKKHWNKMLWLSLGAALLVVLYGIGAGVGWKFFVGPKFSEENFRLQGSVGNSAYLAAYLIFSAFYAFYLWIDTQRQKKRAKEAVLLLSTLAVFAVSFLLAATRGALVGLAGGAGIALIYAGIRRKEWRKRTAAIGVVLIVLLSGLVYFKDTPLVKSIPGSRIFDISLTAKTFQHRTVMWGIAWESFKERPLLGWGPESFGYLFQRNFDPTFYKLGESFGAWFDRAHSVFFDYLAETGILGAGSYLAIFAVFYWEILRSKKIKERVSLTQAAAMAAVPVTYLIQGLVLFDVLVIYINIFMFMSFARWQFENNHERVA